MKSLSIGLLIAILLIAAVPAMAQDSAGDCLTEWQTLVDAQAAALAGGATVDDIRNLTLAVDDPVMVAKADYDACVAASAEGDAVTGDTFEVSGLTNWSNPDLALPLSTTFNVPIPAEDCAGYLLVGESPNFNQGDVLLVVCSDEITGPFVAGGNNSFQVAVEIQGDEFETSYVLEDGYAWFDVDNDVDMDEFVVLTLPTERELNVPVEELQP